MQNFAFISRHAPTAGQIALAAEQGIALLHIGDMDGFTVEPEAVAYRLTSLLGDFDHTPYAGWRMEQVHGVIVVHAAAALRLLPHFNVGVFSNINRAPEGEKPSYEAGALHIWRRDEGYQLGFNRGLSWANQEG
jgi:hypothetical protein